MSKTMRFTFDLSPQANDILKKRAKELHISKGELMKRGLVLIDLAYAEREKGNNLGFIDKNDTVIKQVVGY